MNILSRYSILVLYFLFKGTSVESLENMFDIRYWKCVWKRTNVCPDDEINFYLYTHEPVSVRKHIDVKNPYSLYYHGWKPYNKNVIVIHGFNSTESKSPMTLIRNAYLSRSDYNIFMIDWAPLTIFPCYLSALSNMQLVSKCAAQLYSYIIGAGASTSQITCVGHSLGAHICGMITNHLILPQYKIIGLDPARPIISKYTAKYYRLTRDDAHIVQVIHTNAGLLGDVNQVGHVDFCVNGGRIQPGCKGDIIRQARCSHSQSACYFAQTVTNGAAFIGRPCTEFCPKLFSDQLLPGPSIPMGLGTPDNARGSFCVNIDHDNDCPFN